MVDLRDILDFSDRIAEQFRPKRIVLFGSYAYGTPNEDSDVDLLVVMPHRGPAYLQAARITTAIPHSFPCDVIVRTPELLKKRIGWNDFFLIEITQKGAVLHDSFDPRMGKESRGRLRRRARGFSQPQAAEL